MYNLKRLVALESFTDEELDIALTQLQSMEEELDDEPIDDARKGALNVAIELLIVVMRAREDGSKEREADKMFADT